MLTVAILIFVFTSALSIEEIDICKIPMAQIDKTNRLIHHALISLSLFFRGKQRVHIRFLIIQIFFFLKRVTSSRYFSPRSLARRGDRFKYFQSSR